jgi:MoaA/NifB/PqqE/SkfB family radical SAM enzyme
VRDPDALILAPSGVADLNYDIEADWRLLNTCNYRCAYCFLDAAALGEKLRVFASPEAWESAFNATGKTWLLHMTGGEPSLYPDFVELCRRLTGRHTISFNSNLTNASLADFAERQDPSRVSFINAGLHLAEREERSGNRRFLLHAELLRKKGFPIVVSLVATPAVLERYQDAISLLDGAGLFPVPKLLRGAFDGRVYPQAYSELDRARFRAYAAQARQAYAGLLAQRSEAFTINMFDDDEFLGGQPSFIGRSCEAGHRFVRLNPDGEVFRCSQKTGLGNLLAGTFTPAGQASPCETSYCFYFCRKYSSSEAGTIEPEAPPSAGSASRTLELRARVLTSLRTTVALRHNV